MGKGRVRSTPCSASRAFLLLRQLPGRRAWWRGREEAPKLSCRSASPQSLSRFLLSSLQRGEPAFLAGGRRGHGKGRVGGVGGRYVLCPTLPQRAQPGSCEGWGTSQHLSTSTPTHPSHTGGWPGHRPMSAACSMLHQGRGRRDGSRHRTDGPVAAGGRVLHGQPACIPRCCLSLLRACLGARLRTWGGVVTRGQANGHPCKCAPQPRLPESVIFRCIKKGHLEAGIKSFLFL